MEKFFAIAIKITQKGSEFKATGETDIALLKMMIGEMEIIKSLFITQLNSMIELSKEDNAGAKALHQRS